MAKNVSTPATARTRARWRVIPSRTSTKDSPPRTSSRDDLEVRAPVLRAPAVAVVAGHRLVRPVADHVELVPLEPLRHQVLRDRVRARPREPHVRIAAAHVVGVPGDAEVGAAEGGGQVDDL